MAQNISADEARRRAEARFEKITQREKEAAESMAAEQARQKAVAAKIERLRSLRLAKEAEDQAAAALELAYAPTAPAPKRKRKAAAAKA